MDEKKKKALITLSKVFPSKHRKAGCPTGFRDKVLNGSKIHTIRLNYEWWKCKEEKIQKGEMYLSLREWTDKPYNSVQEEWLRLPKIGLQKITMKYEPDRAYPLVWIDGKKIPIYSVAKRDGLSIEDLVEWFFDSNKTNVFEGVIIHFTEFRY
jgi:hypothetical protein